MVSPDVTILVYAHRTEAPGHEAYRHWLEALIHGSEPFALSALVAVSFVRIVTNPRIVAAPATPLSVALEMVEEVVDHPNCRLIAPAPDHWRRIADLCRATRATGDLIADAQHAAVAMAEGCTWVTNDRDFARFAPHGLKWEHLDLS